MGAHSSEATRSRQESLLQTARDIFFYLFAWCRRMDTWMKPYKSLYADRLIKTDRCF